MEITDILENKRTASIEEQLEAANQNLYECRLQLSAAKALEKDYQNEIEILQKELVQEREKTETRILLLEKSAEDTKNSLDEQMRSLENQLLHKDEIILSLEVDLEQLKTPPEVPDHSEVDSLRDEIDKLKQKQDLLEENLKILKASNTDYLKLNTILDDKLKVTKQENENMRESLEVQKEELIKANDAVQNLQDEALCLKSELESLKSKPFEAKGNSLFSEVDDRRVELQSTVDTMKTKYLDMKRERTKHLNIIANLSNENAILCERRKTEILEWNEDMNILEEALKDQIRTLQDLIENYKKQIADYEKQHQGVASSCEKFKYFETALSKKQKEITSLLEKMERISLGERTLSYELVDVRRDLRKWMFKASKLECDANKFKAENQILKTQLDENDQQELLPENIENKPKFVLKSNLKQVKQQPVLAEVAEHLNETKEIILDINNKENSEDAEVKRETLNDSDDNKENVTITNTKKVVFCDNAMNNVNCERLSLKRKTSSFNKRCEK